MEHPPPPPPPQGPASAEEQLWEACSIGSLSTIFSLLFTPAVSDPETFVQEATAADWESLQPTNVNVNWADPELLRTPLYRAAGHGQVAALMVLLRHPHIELNKANLNSASPLFIACQQDRIENVRKLLEDQRADVNQATVKGATPLFIACQKGHANVVRQMLADPRIEVNKSKENRATPLNVACKRGHVDVVELLLAHPAVQVNWPTEVGITPLMSAIENDHPEVVELLLRDPRVSVNAVNEDGLTTLALACEQNESTFIPLLLMAPSINPNARMADDSTALFFAIREHKFEGAKWFIGLVPNLDLEAKDLDGQRALDVARICEDVESEQIILRYLENPVKTRIQVCSRLSFAPHFSAQIFAMVIFCCDDYARVKANLDPALGDLRRFLTILKVLPLELQMVICNRVYSLTRDLIPFVEREAAFKKVVMMLTGALPRSQQQNAE